MPRLFPALVVTGVLVLGVVGIAALGGDSERPSPGVARGGTPGLAATVGDRYRPPAAGEAGRLAGAFAALVDGRPRIAARLGRGIGYGVRQDGGTWVLEPQAGSRAAGWGVFAYAPSGEAGLVVEVPHPRSDRLTERAGVELFTAARAGALLLAGARRDSVDVAHDRESPFAAVSAALARPGAVHVQIHGFDDAEHPLGDVVVSSGRARPDPVARRVAAVLRRAGYEVCLYTGGRCSALAGRTNVQQISAHAAGAQFVHVELAPGLRDSAQERRRVVLLLARALARA